jgi:hypothetical protein
MYMYIYVRVFVVIIVILLACQFTFLKCDCEERYLLKEVQMEGSEEIFPINKYFCIEKSESEPQNFICLDRGLFEFLWR